VAKHIGYNQRTKVDNKWELGEHHKEHVANHIGGIRLYRTDVAMGNCENVIGNIGKAYGIYN